MNECIVVFSIVVTFLGVLGWWLRGIEVAKTIEMDLTISTITKNLSTITKTLSVAVRERDELKDDLKSANQTIADMMSDLSMVRMERQGAIEELEKVKKERDELQTKVCELKTNGIEVLNLRAYKERMLARLKSIINDEVYE